VVEIREDQNDYEDAAWNIGIGMKLKERLYEQHIRNHQGGIADQKNPDHASNPV
jgi:hypothetical protein